jgi:hypothetical protein
MIQILEEMKSVKRRKKDKKRSPIINSKNLHDLDHSRFGLCLLCLAMVSHEPGTPAEITRGRWSCQHWFSESRTDDCHRGTLS